MLSSPGSHAPSIRRDAIVLIGAIALSYPIGLALDPYFLLPLLNALPAWWIMTRRLRAGDLRGAVLLMLVFPLALAILGTVSLASWPTTDGGFYVESSPVLGPSAVWTLVNGSQTVVGPNYQMTLSTINGDSMFFRLRR